MRDRNDTSTPTVNQRVRIQRVFGYDFEKSWKGARTDGNWVFTVRRRSEGQDRFHQIPCIQCENKGSCQTLPDVERLPYSAQNMTLGEASGGWKTSGEFDNPFFFGFF